MMAFGRTFLYHHTAPKGIIFDDEDEYLKALEDGWVDSPGKINQVSPPPPDPKEVKEPPSTKPKRGPGRKTKTAISGRKK